MKSEEEARESVRRMVEMAQERARQAHAMVGELEALRVVGESREGTRVVLGHTGGLLEVTLGDRLGDADLRTIEQSINQANADAQFRLKAQVQELAGRHYGESETTSHFSQQYDQLFPDAAPTDRPEGPSTGGVLR